MDSMILLTKGLHEVGYLTADIDFEVGNSEASNDFEITTTQKNIEGMYIPHTEWGGLVEYTETSNSTEEITYKGYTWRGLLAQRIIIPSKGSDYKIVSGDANTILKSMVENILGGIFTVPAKQSGITINKHQFLLYETLLDGLEEMLSEVGARLYIHAEKEKAGEKIKIYVEAVKAATLIGAYTADSPVQMTFTSDGMGINHLYACGKGELQARTKMDIYINNKGVVSKSKYYTGLQERVAYYDANNVEDDELFESGKKKLLELASSTSVEIKADDSVNLEVGDIVKGYFNGITVTAPIEKKIYKVSGGSATAEYTAGDCSLSASAKAYTYSVIGDSYSAFYGDITPAGNTKYYPHADVSDPSQMWYRLVASAQGLTLRQNNAYAGALVCDLRGDGTSFIKRIKDTIDADYLFIEGGINDSRSASDPGSPVYSDWTEEQLKLFLPALCYLFAYVKNHFRAKPIYVIMKDYIQDSFVSGAKTVCEYYGITYVECSGYAIDDSALHPTAAGMQTISEFINEVF